MNKELLNLSRSLDVLYVEDNEEIRTQVSDLMGTFFKSIDCAVDGEDGLSFYKKNSNKYSIIITDLDMPKMDGLDMIEQIRIDNKTIPIIIVSAMHDPKQFTKSVKFGVDGYCLKPLNMFEFVDVVEKIISKIELKQKVSQYEQSLEEKITAQARLLEKQYLTDSVTGLYNREKLLKDLTFVEDGKVPVLILINIDGFRLYNELYGINIGNEILKHFAKVLEQYNENRDYTIYRVSGDEFVLYKQDVFMGIEQYEKDLDDLYEYVDLHHIVIDTLHKDIIINITTGISFSTVNPLGKADMALHKAKKEGRNFTGYHHDLDREQELAQNIYWRDEITKAIEEKRVVPFYQPIVDKNKKIVKYEALVRIKQYDENGNVVYITPEKFLKLSEKTKQYIRLTSTVIEEALEIMSKKNINISLNITYADIKNETIYNTLKTSIEKYHVAQKTNFDISNNVIFELLESQSIECFDTFKHFVDEFKELGVQIIIDDFGTGFSNFGQIVGLNPNYIKIDGFLMQTINSDAKSLNLVKAIVKFAQELNIKTIASYVNTQEIFELGLAIGIDEFQGNYFGAAQLEHFLDH